MPRIIRRQYSCHKCPAYCCTYEHIEVTDRDLERLAAHFGIEPGVAERRFTKLAKMDGRRTRVLRHRKDEIFGTACRFLDPKTRQCTIYMARPTICRTYPGTARCGFYDFLSSERRAQEDPDYVPSFTRR
jgi:Fe-S-cluster containining protein